jgi:NADH-quinone oxidoreductase subunit M
MTLLELPWLDLTIASALVGAVWVSRVKSPNVAARLGLFFTGLAFACAFLAWLGFYLGVGPGATGRASLQSYLFGREVFFLDELSAPLVPAVALLHFLTALATTQTKVRRFSFSWSLASESIRLAMFSSPASWVLVGLLLLCSVPPYFELRIRHRPTRVYVLHMVLFAGLMVAGWAGASAHLQGGHAPTWAAVLLMLAILVRCGTVPAHCWLTDWFEHTSFGIALLFVAPLAGVYAAVRLVLPIAPAWVLQSIGLTSLLTAVYAAGMAVVQQDTRRVFANLFLSHASLVLVGLELHTEMSMTGSLCLWFSVILSLGGFGLTLRAIESRFGRLSMMQYHGLYQHTPALAVCFLLTGLGCVGFPGTLGFISTELLVESAVKASPYVGIVVIGAAALNGIAVVRAYLILFTGARHVSTVSLGSVLRERIAVLTLAALILGGGLFPQPGVESRHRAAAAILQLRLTAIETENPTRAELDAIEMPRGATSSANSLYLPASADRTASTRPRGERPR